MLAQRCQAGGIVVSLVRAEIYSSRARGAEYVAEALFGMPRGDVSSKTTLIRRLLVRLPFP